jgi:hypothetical protein
MSAELVEKVERRTRSSLTIPQALVTGVLAGLPIGTAWLIAEGAAGTVTEAFLRAMWSLYRWKVG